MCALNACTVICQFKHCSRHTLEQYHMHKLLMSMAEALGGIQSAASVFITTDTLTRSKRCYFFVKNLLAFNDLISCKQGQGCWCQAKASLYFQWAENVFWVLILSGVCCMTILLLQGVIYVSVNIRNTVEGCYNFMCKKVKPMRKTFFVSCLNNTGSLPFL